MNTPEKFFQHVRSDFKFEKDMNTDLVWMIWPEFEEIPGVPMLEENKQANSEGTATMWILNQEQTYLSELYKRVYVGAKGYLVAGATLLAEAEVIELLENIHSKYD